MSETEGNYQVKSERPPYPPFVSSPGYIPNELRPSQSSGVAGSDGSVKPHDCGAANETLNNERKPMIEKKTWEEFRQCQLLWWVNRMIHIFGWAIVIEIEDDGRITNAYPARVKFRGFAEKNEEEGFVGLSNFLEKESATLASEAREE